ncbi:MAG TPA: NAD(P)-dependent oxidoreductase [Solirubrobacteraceae bacterium]|nr:NAD(P)-dependent oxidoreductase [Solirubrobacteraceae bacterium]
MSKDNGRRLGWVGAGRMGHALAARLLAAGHDVAVWNRTRSKAESLAEAGATVVDSPAQLADRDVVFTMVAGPADFKEVVLGADGILAGGRPSVIVDLTTVSPEASAEVRDEAARRGTALLAAPVSGNPKVVKAGRVTLVVSGPREAYDEVEPLLALLGAGVTYVGDGERARLAKICHNLMLGVVAQCMAEIVVLAEKGGMSRNDFLEFLNGSVMGSMFTRYKTPAYVNLDFTPTFTPLLLRKDFDLGMQAARELDVPMPVAAAAQQTVQALIGSGHTDEDFAALLEQQARAAGLELVSENADIDEGLEVREPAPAGG